MATSKDLMNQELIVEPESSCFTSYTEYCLDVSENLNQMTNGGSEQNIQTPGDISIGTGKVNYTENEDVVIIPAEDELEEHLENEDMLRLKRNDPLSVISGARNEDVVIIPAKDEIEECLENEDMLWNLLKRIDPSSIKSGAKALKEIAGGIIEQFAKSDQSLSILFAGKTGVGKSSLINGVLGKRITEEGSGANSCTSLSSLQNHFEEYVQYEDKQIKIIVWDSPGLLDGLDKDIEYLRQLKIVLSRVDLVVYCISMRERFEESAKKALAAFIQMKPDVLRNTVIALTQSNDITYPEEYDNEKDDVIHFTKVFQEYKDNIEASLRKCNISEDTIEALPIVPTGYHRVTRSIPNPWRLHAHCRHWLQPFWLMCFMRCKEAGRAALIMSNEHRITNNNLDESKDTKSKPVEFQPIFLHDSQSGKEEKRYRTPFNNLSLWRFLLLITMTILIKKKFLS